MYLGRLIIEFSPNQACLVFVHEVELNSAELREGPLELRQALKDPSPALSEASAVREVDYKRRPKHSILPPNQTFCARSDRTLTSSSSPSRGPPRALGPRRNRQALSQPCLPSRTSQSGC